MAHLVRKYNFAAEKDVMLKPPTLVDPISTAWYKENMGRKPSNDRVLTGTDLISSKIRESLSSTGSVRGLSQKFAQYSTLNAHAPAAKIDLYSPVSGGADKYDSRRYPSRSNDTKNSGSKFPASNYVSTYASTYGSSNKNYLNDPFNTASTTRRDPSTREYSKARNDVHLMNGSAATASGSVKRENTSVDSWHSNGASASLGLPSRDQSSTSPGRFNSMNGGVSIPKAASYHSDEYYMRQIDDILNVHNGVLFNASPAQVTDFMFIGGYKDADNWPNLRRLGITHVLNMAAPRKSTVNPYPPKSGVVGYEAFDADDHEMYNVMQHFSRAKAFIDRARWSNGKVLVHCAMGVNRSGAMCCAYMVTEQKMGLLEAMRKLKKARGTVLCNRGFQKQLLRLAKQKGAL